jgi:hypothetical protein
MHMWEARGPPIFATFYSFGRGRHFGKDDIVMPAEYFPIYATRRVFRKVARRRRSEKFR